MTDPQVVPTVDDVAVDESSDSRRRAFVALVLLLVGATMATVGVSLAFGVPVGLMVLGALALAGGVALGVS
jgi:hypothetical protein